MLTSECIFTRLWLYKAFKNGLSKRLLQCFKKRQIFAMQKIVQGLRLQMVSLKVPKNYFMFLQGFLQWRKNNLLSKNIFAKNMWAKVFTMLKLCALKCFMIRQRFECSPIVSKVLMCSSKDNKSIKGANNYLDKKTNFQQQLEHARTTTVAALVFTEKRCLRKATMGNQSSIHTRWSHKATLSPEHKKAAAIFTAGKAQCMLLLTKFDI